jgi:hypothetical protein
MGPELNRCMSNKMVPARNAWLSRKDASSSRTMASWKNAGGACFKHKLLVAQGMHTVRGSGQATKNQNESDNQKKTNQP